MNRVWTTEQIPEEWKNGTSVQYTRREINCNVVIIEV
jgi:hypothetical protein